MRLHETLAMRDDAPMLTRRAFPLSISSANADGVLEGYGSVFGVRDTYGDIVTRGAFLKSLADHRGKGTMPAMLWQHNAEEPIGVWTDMVEDERGLKISGRITLESDYARDKYARLKAGAVRGLSIGFMVPEGGAVRDRETGIRTVSEIDLWEVSIVTFAANQQAMTTAVKSADVAGVATIRQAERALRDAGFSADAAGAYLAQVKRIVLAERDARDAAARATEAAGRLLRSLST